VRFLGLIVVVSLSCMLLSSGCSSKTPSANNPGGAAISPDTTDKGTASEGAGGVGLDNKGKRKMPQPPPPPKG
jgi:hypothetical protein